MRKYFEVVGLCIQEFATTFCLVVIMLCICSINTKLRKIGERQIEIQDKLDYTSSKIDFIKLNEEYLL